MKSNFYKFIAFLMFGTLIFGCSPKAIISKDEIKNEHDILIVPFKSPPIAIREWGVGTFLLGGAIGAAMVDGATREGREKVVETLNKNSSQWQPCNVIAQECQNLIKNRASFQIRNISIVENREMPGLENKKQNGSIIFTAESQLYAFGSPWMNAGNRMMKDSNYLKYVEEYPQSDADWALEVFSTYIHIEKMRELSFNVILKLVETNSGKKVALDYSYDDFTISLEKDISNFKLFEDEFRNAARTLCSKSLRNMGLIY